MTVRGGYNIYGQAIGILMLETHFPRIAGDIGNVTTFDFPVVYKIVKSATGKRVLEADARLLGPLIKAAQELEKIGVQAITTICNSMT